MTRVATCRCGQARLACEGEPVRLSVCHCRDCQHRSGSAFAAQARFATAHIRFTGDMITYRRENDGRHSDWHFCPHCGSTLYFTTDSEAGLVGVPIGNFDQPRSLGAPLFSGFEEYKLDWAEVTSASTEHFD